MNQTLQVEQREVMSQGALRQIRLAGKLPGVVYGKGLESPVTITLESKQVQALLRSNPHSVIEMDVPRIGKQTVMMAEIQRDSMSREVQHIDFKRIDMNEKIHTSVRIELQGKSIGEQEGGMIQIIMHELEIECYPKDIPDAIVADVSTLAVGDQLSVSDLKLPAGVASREEASTVIVSILAPQKALSEDEADAAADKAEEDRKHSEAAQAVDKK
ncbi:MAG: 50S ribosomal protein L25 [Candidatus Cohnella colombiensis]|uniref:Large ribosomal subunit protein bL25 n=1 Tax=Candidatus Cohnella colombiensis TaxID=3121368 RepID=A0AA95JBN5_9BACL|nr:MAG: 50S ribosomal protein L25 [Cohnella sp.]